MPHIGHVRECQEDIFKQLEDNKRQLDKNRGSWERPRVSVPQSYGRLQAEQDVRFSRVYGESGHFVEALKLQERALAFVSRRLGPDHPLAIGLSLFLTKTLWERLTWRR